MIALQQRKTGQKQARQVPLCVDLDGTLIHGDLLLEAVFVLLRQNALYLFLLPLWLWKGKAYLKEQVALRVQLDPATLPYREDVIEFLRAERADGGRNLHAVAEQRRYRASHELEGAFEELDEQAVVGGIRIEDQLGDRHLGIRRDGEARAVDEFDLDAGACAGDDTVVQVNCGAARNGASAGKVSRTPTPLVAVACRNGGVGCRGVFVGCESAQNHSARATQAHSLHGFRGS